MTDEQISKWKERRDHARGIEDENARKVALEMVYDERDDMEMSCIAHQSLRSKEAIVKIDAIDSRLEKVETALPPLKATCKDYSDNKLRGEGAIIFWRILRYAAASGFGAVILKMLEQ